MASSIIALVFIAFSVMAFAYMVVQTSRLQRRARWRRLMLGSLSAGVLVGIAQCLRLLIEINRKL
jgi:undecaprenyl pyrophosphate phosphatase UppP